jgi:hypothetical protein
MGAPTGIWVVFGGRALLDGYLMVYEAFILYECPYNDIVGDSIEFKGIVSGLIY